MFGNLQLKMIVKIAFFLLNIGHILAFTTPVQKCDDDSYKLLRNVTIYGSKGVCTKFPCEFPSGSDVKADIEFLVEKEVKKIVMKADVKVFDTYISYPLPDANHGCNHLTNTYCPIEPDTDAQIEIRMEITKAVPKINVDVKFFLEDEHDSKICCFIFKTKIV